MFIASRTFSSLLLGLALLPLASQAQRLNPDDIDIEIVGDQGGRLQQYPVSGRAGDYRAYLEARKGERYALRVRNLSNQRVGLVIAVDGRNIISGERSELEPGERMYVLGPRQQATYSGWRTGRDKVNRFYFTDEGASYAAAWGDHSAMGVIAIAAYAEERPQQTYSQTEERRAKPYSRNQPGTGFGEDEYSPSRQVEFDPVRRPFARYFIKYEWRDSLCEKQVLQCRKPAPPPQSKLTADDLTIEIVDDRGRDFRQFPVRSKNREYRAYLQAERDANYGVRVSNHSDQPVGLVLAVDGRNAISGKRSELEPDERMYVLGPGESATYAGWRTGRDKVNRFYFTDEGASYAAAWGDHSAMGVIAIAAYQEKPDSRRLGPEVSDSRRAKPYSRNQAGTGYGDEEYSPSRKVEFDPQNRPFARYFVKYEWRDSLCEKGVLKCKPRKTKDSNRFWDDDGFAKPPPFRDNTN